MSGIDNLDYSNWKSNFYKIASSVDTDGIFGLNIKEIELFKSKAIDSGINESSINELLGASFSQTKTNNSKLNEAINYYNNVLSTYERSKITSETYNIGQENLYKMEKAIDEAFINCEAYQDILIVPQKRPKPEKLLNFDIEYLRNLTKKDMEALHELKDNIEQIIETANGIDKHNPPEKTEYDIEALALEHLGMSYEEFYNEYKDEIEYCKTVSYADLNQMNERQAFVYGKAKNYAKAMLLATINEAHTVRWDSGDRILEETNKYSDDFLKISDFEYDGITQEGLENLSSGIMRLSFEEALITYYDTTDNINIPSNNEHKTRKKMTKNGIIIEMPDGTKYNYAGQKIE